MGQRQLPITAKETLALLLALQDLAADLHDARVDVFVDSKVLVESREMQVSKSPCISTALKDIFRFCSTKNLGLSLSHIPSKDNPADAPSRTVSDLDTSLSDVSWNLVEQMFGPHSIDLLALPSNARRDRSGRLLRFFAPTPCHESAGTNVFSQSIAPFENAYVFPPFVLVSPLLRFLLPQGCAFSIVVPDLCPRKYWWPILQRRALASIKLGCQGDNHVLLFPSKSWPTPWVTRPVQWDLWVFRVGASN